MGQGSGGMGTGELSFINVKFEMLTQEEYEWRC